MINTSVKLTEQVVQRLNDLIRTNIDSSKGLHEAAEVVNDPELRSRFIDLARDRQINAAELRQFIESHQGWVDMDGGTVLGAAHRWWLDMRARMAGGDPAVVLNEAERGEDFIKHSYEDALHETGDPSVDHLLQRQYERVRSGHDAVRALRDAYEARSN